jgi:hypothetical protein
MSRDSVHFKKLLTFEDVANELGCNDITVRMLVVEERSLPAYFVTQIGYTEKYTEHSLFRVSFDGMVFDLGNSTLDLVALSNNHGYLRVQRTDLDAYMVERRLEPKDRSRNAGTHWPNHQTKKLTALRLAALKFWSNYDPTQPDTAPKNQEVIEWLQKEHKIGATPAKEMASILRPEKLRTGPR